METVTGGSDTNSLFAKAQLCAEQQLRDHFDHWDKKERPSTLPSRFNLEGVESYFRLVTAIAKHKPGRLLRSVKTELKAIAESSKRIEHIITSYVGLDILIGYVKGASALRGALYPQVAALLACEEDWEGKGGAEFLKIKHDCGDNIQLSVRHFLPKELTFEEIVTQIEEVASKHGKGWVGKVCKIWDAQCPIRSEEQMKHLVTALMGKTDATRRGSLLCELLKREFEHSYLLEAYLPKKGEAKPQPVSQLVRFESMLADGDLDSVRALFVGVSPPKHAGKIFDRLVEQLLAGGNIDKVWQLRTVCYWQHDKRLEEVAASDLDQAAALISLQAADLSKGWVGRICSLWKACMDRFSIDEFEGLVNSLEVIEEADRKRTLLVQLVQVQAHNLPKTDRKKWREFGLTLIAQMGGDEKVKQAFLGYLGEGSATNGLRKKNQKTAVAQLIPRGTAQTDWKELLESVRAGRKGWLDRVSGQPCELVATKIFFPLLAEKEGHSAQVKLLLRGMPELLKCFPRRYASDSAKLKEVYHQLLRLCLIDPCDATLQALGNTLVLPRKLDSKSRAILSELFAVALPMAVGLNQKSSAVDKLLHRKFRSTRVGGDLLHPTYDTIICPASEKEKKLTLAIEVLEKVCSFGSSPLATSQFCYLTLLTHLEGVIREGPRRKKSGDAAKLACRMTNLRQRAQPIQKIQESSLDVRLWSCVIRSYVARGLPADVDAACELYKFHPRPEKTYGAPATRALLKALASSASFSHHRIELRIVFKAAVKNRFIDELAKRELVLEPLRKRSIEDKSMSACRTLIELDPASRNDLQIIEVCEKSAKSTTASLGERFREIQSKKKLPVDELYDVVQLAFEQLSGKELENFWAELLETPAISEKQCRDILYSWVLSEPDVSKIGLIGGVSTRLAAEQRGKSWGVAKRDVAEQLWSFLSNGSAKFGKEHVDAFIETVRPISKNGELMRPFYKVACLIATPEASDRETIGMLICELQKVVGFHCPKGRRSVLSSQGFHLLP